MGDDYAGDRLAALDEVERQLRLALSLGAGPDGPRAARRGDPPAWSARMAETVRRLDLPTEPLFDLVQANRQDQIVSRYETFEDLVGYCRLSANPVGRMVLAIFGVATPERNAWSDSICTALQLVEHWQDVAEDAIVGPGLPAPGRHEALRGQRRGAGPPARRLRRPPAAGRRRRSFGGVAGRCWRSKRPGHGGCSTTGTPLVASLNGRLRLAVAASWPAATPPWTAWPRSTSTSMPSPSRPPTLALRRPSGPSAPQCLLGQLGHRAALGLERGAKALNEAAVALAYKQCERITRSRARNFYYGIRLLPPRQRSAMCALYAMARRIDDIGDGIAGRRRRRTTGRQVADDDRLAALRAVRTSLELLAAAARACRRLPRRPGDPVLTALADTARQFPLPIDAFLELVEGCEWDIAGRRYADLRRARRVLPPGRRHHRPPVPGHLRQQRRGRLPNPWPMPWA